MSFVASIFLWTLASLSVPILIALWNRRQKIREKFGAYYLLRKSVESKTRRIRLLELIKLLNRLFLLTVVILILADPFRVEKVIGEASEGFAILVDSGRVMQGTNTSGQSLAKMRMERLLEILSRMPQQSRGMILWVSNRCDIEEIRSSEITARAGEWIDHFENQEAPLFNRPSLHEGVLQCLQKVESVFSGKNPYKVFISPMPLSLDQTALEASGMSLETLSSAQELKAENLQIDQEMNGDVLSLVLKSGPVRAAHLVLPESVEALGNLESTIDLQAKEASWLWLEGPTEGDPWIHQNLISLRQKVSRELTVWAAKESPGFLSLVAALRNHPDLRVIRQVGGRPQGEPLIIYGPIQQIPPGLGKTWFFLDPNGATPFEIRDKKTLSSSFVTADILRSFQIPTALGRITIKRYLILDPNRFETIATFEDGAPSLLKDRDSLAGHYLSPFDLEDLTTDLALEPMFIPFLYENVQKWISEDSVGGAQDVGSELIWALPSAIKPTAKAIQRKDWPGIYRQGSSYSMVSPVAYPGGFFVPQSRASSEATKDEEVSYRPLLYRLTSGSIFLELLLCLISMPILLRRMSFLFLAGFIGFSSAESQVRDVRLGIFKGMDADRKTALLQVTQDAAIMSNLDLGSPEEVSIDRLWEYAVVVFSSTGRFGPFSEPERAKIRDYLERGGLFIFDDPLALTDTLFARSVREELSKIFPGREMENIPKDDVLFRTYFLLNEVSGRKLSSPNLEGLKFDRRWVAVFSSNDLLGANLRSPRGDYSLSVSPYGISQRILAQRLMINFLMYGATLDYKDDAIHLPHILKRRVR